MNIPDQVYEESIDKAMTIREAAERALELAGWKFEPIESDDDIIEICEAIQLLLAARGICFSGADSEQAYLMMDIADLIYKHQLDD